MRIFLRKAIQKIIRLLKINKLMPIFYRSKIVRLDEESLKQARDVLEEASPNPKTSCITQNTVEPKVDVHIIVPAYNAEKYIKECIDSVVFPPKKYTWHLTIINDGSTDKTGEVLRVYENIENVEIITQKNKGFSGARNTGLNHIKGKYVTFLDSDDYLSWEGIESMLNLALSKDLDAVDGSWIFIAADGKFIKEEKRKAGMVSPCGGLSGYTCGKVIKSRFFENICFPEKYWFEDSLLEQIVFPMLSLAEAVSEKVYYYRKNSQGISQTNRKFKKSIDSFWITEQLHKERQVLGIINTQDYYEYILRMVKLTYSRVQYQSKIIKEAVLVLFIDFIKKNFSNYSTQVVGFKPIEKAIQNNDIGKLKAYCLWL